MNPFQILNKKVPIPILENVAVMPDGVAKVSDSRFYFTIGCNISTETPFLLNLETFKRLNRMGGVFSAYVDDGKVWITGDNFKMECGVEDFGDYIDFPEYHGEYVTCPDISDLASIHNLKNNNFEDFVSIGDNFCVSTNGFVLGVSKTTLHGISYNVPKSAAPFITGAKIASQGDNLFVKGDGYRLVVRGSTINYPDWRSVLPKQRGSSSITVKKSDLKEALRHVELAVGSDYAIRAVIGDGCLVLRSDNADGLGSKVEFRVPADLAGESAELLMSINVFKDFLGSLDLEEYTFNYDVGGRLITMQEGTEYRLMMLMVQN